ncbi:hypothetical protein [Paenibacillus sp. sgz5001063]|uniref:hypothetical protein n=1 Tax=Paenibacillus sp. sgz5001063 TaxID=3242474 RepID=UPI0036D3C899
MKQKVKRTYAKLLSSALLLLGLSVLFPSPVAKANYFNDIYNGLQSFSELPGEVNQLQESYQQTTEELQQTKDQLDQTLQQMAEYQTQNAALQEQNRQLSQVVNELKDDRTAREKYYNRIKNTVITGIALVLGYFLLIRVLRLGMRHRSRKGDRLH